MTKIPDMHQPHPLQPLWSLSLQSLQADALDTALTLGLFSHLRTPCCAGAMAQTLPLDIPGLRLLLELLWSMNVLERTTHASGQYRYHLRPDLADYLTPGNPDYCGDSLHFRLQSMRKFGAGLPDRLRHGAPSDGAALPSSWAQAAQAQIWQEQGSATEHVAMQAVSQLTFLEHGPRQFLDLGGGPGRVAMAMARQWPEAQGVIFDLPQTRPVAQQAVDLEGLGNRLRVLGGDMRTDDFGQGYDLVWCSSALHFCDDVPAMLARIVASMAPGGWLVAAHAEIPFERNMATHVLPYYLPLRMRGQTMWDSGAMAAMMARAGLVDIRQSLAQGYPIAPACIVAGRKEA